MPNIGTVLRQEISRLSRKESRVQIDSTKKATTQHRKDIASLKRQVAQLERNVRVLTRDSPGKTWAAPDSSPKRVRFVAKGLRSLRKHLALSAADFGFLAGVSAQSIYNWERESTCPRGEQLAKLAALRGISKREAGEKLLAATGKRGRSKIR